MTPSTDARDVVTVPLALWRAALEVRHLFKALRPWEQLKPGTALWGELADYDDTLPHAIIEHTKAFYDAVEQAWPEIAAAPSPSPAGEVVKLLEEAIAIEEDHKKAIEAGSPHDDDSVRRHVFARGRLSAFKEIQRALRSGDGVVGAGRCEICGWPLAESREKGCVPGDCSYRPEQGSAEWRRIEARRRALSSSDQDTGGSRG